MDNKCYINNVIRLEPLIMSISVYVYAKYNYNSSRLVMNAWFLDSKLSTCFCMHSYI